MTIERLRILLTILCLLPFPARALPPWPETLRGYWKEMRTPEPMPTFCKHRFSPKGGPRWVGPKLSGVNHLCNSKVKHHICLKYHGKDRSACLSALAKGIKDVIDNAKQKNLNNHPMLPYLHTEYGNFLKEAGIYTQATREYLTAIRKNRKYLPAYVKLADTFVKTKQYDNARKTLQYALKIQKNRQYAHYIKKRLARIDELEGRPNGHR